MTHKALEEYFHKIVNKPDVKETPMLELSMFFTAQLEKLKALLTKPVAFKEEPETAFDDGYWAFEMYTPEWINEHGETVKLVHTCFIEPHEGTWMEVLDKILDAMEAHYGYNIKEQVYYSVAFPLNDPDCAGYGRSLNDAVLQKLLLSYPEVYEVTKESYE